MAVVTDLSPQASGIELLELLERREVSAVELTDLHLDRIGGDVGTSVNAVIATDADRSRAEAAEIDARRAAGDGVGPLGGLPITVKDSFDVAGFRTTHGRLSDSRIAAVDAPVVRRLRDAGAIVLGKTNVPVYLADFQAANDAFGRTTNPWDFGRSPGGSSGGSGAAVAAGLSALDLGSDLSGSLRVPVSWCGLFGHRPSNRLVSKLGHMPWPDGGSLEPSISVVGPLVRSAADLQPIMDAIIGLEGEEATALRIELPPARVESLEGCRVGLWLDDPVCVIDSETRSAIRGFADRLVGAGAKVEDLPEPPSVGGEALELFLRLCAGEIAHGLDDESWAFNRELAASDSSSPSAVQARRYQQLLKDALDDFEEVRSTMARWRAVFESYDIVLCPATPRAAIRHSDEPRDTRTTTIDDQVVESDVIFHWSCISSIGKLPATVVPVGLGGRSGLPIGAQLLGPFLEDRTPIRVAALAEADGLIGYQAPPGF